MKHKAIINLSHIMKCLKDTLPQPLQTLYQNKINNKVSDSLFTIAQTGRPFLLPGGCQEFETFQRVTSSRGRVRYHHSDIIYQIPSYPMELFFQRKVSQKISTRDKAIIIKDDSQQMTWPPHAYLLCAAVAEQCATRTCTYRRSSYLLLIVFYFNVHLGVVCFSPVYCF